MTLKTFTVKFQEEKMKNSSINSLKKISSVVFLILDTNVNSLHFWYTFTN